ncbi:MAG: CDP-alcohol phosphatidyltransferase family protein [Polyangiales bacterium]
MASVRVPKSSERWTVFNAFAALGAAALSVGCADLRPALLVSGCSLGWLLWRHAALRNGAANLVTVCRMGLLCAALSFAAERGAWVAAAACLLFTLDGVDGWLARRLDAASELGAQLDMETDSHALLLLDLQLVIHDGYPGWVLIAGALRYLYVITRWLAGPRELHERRSSIGRWIFSLVFVSRIVACLPNTQPLATPLLAIATLAVGASFAPDFRALRAAD